MLPTTSKAQCSLLPPIYRVTALPKWTLPATDDDDDDDFGAVVCRQHFSMCSFVVAMPVCVPPESAVL